MPSMGRETGSSSIARHTTIAGRRLQAGRVPAADLCYSCVNRPGEPVRIDLFHMERTQCLYENEIEYNLSESGVEPLRVDELLEGSSGPDWLRQAPLKYPPSRGSDILRDRIALFYGQGATRDHVMVTNGGSGGEYHPLSGPLGERGPRKRSQFAPRP